MIPKELGLIGSDQYLNEGGTELLISLLKHLRPGNYGKAFIPLMEAAGVPMAVELVIVRNGKVLLTYRDDAHFTGWHTPGTYLRRGEDWQTAAQRCADKELKVPVRLVRVLDVFNHPDNPRFHDACTLLLCEADGEPQSGEWFSSPPQDLIPVHRKYWPAIDRLLRG